MRHIVSESLGPCELWVSNIIKKIMYAKSSEDECPVGFRAYKQLASFMIHETKRLMLHKIKSLISCDSD